MALKAFCDGSVFGHVHGSGRPGILALHGWGRSGSDFDAVLSGSNAIALDLPGFGASPLPESSMGAHGYAHRISAILNEFDTPPVVIGHSFGGRVAVALQADRPGAFRGMVLTGVPLLRRQSVGRPPMGYRIVRSLNRLGLLSDGRLENMKRTRGSADYRAATGVMRDVLVITVNESYEDELGSLQIPVKMVWGSEDTEVPLSIAERAGEILGPNASLEVVEDGGHFLPVTHPETLRSALDGLM